MAVWHLQEIGYGLPLISDHNYTWSVLYLLLKYHVIQIEIIYIYLSAHCLLDTTYTYIVSSVFKALKYRIVNSSFCSFMVMDPGPGTYVS